MSRPLRTALRLRQTLVELDSTARSKQTWTVAHVFSPGRRVPSACASSSPVRGGSCASVFQVARRGPEPFVARRRATTSPLRRTPRWCYDGADPEPSSISRRGRVNRRQPRQPWAGYWYANLMMGAHVLRGPSRLHTVREDGDTCIRSSRRCRSAEGQPLNQRIQASRKRLCCRRAELPGAVPDEFNICVPVNLYGPRRRPRDIRDVTRDSRPCPPRWSTRRTAASAGLG